MLTRFASRLLWCAKCRKGTKNLREQRSGCAYVIHSRYDWRHSSKGEESVVPKGRQPRRLASLASPHHPRAAGGRKSQSTFHCRGAERSRQLGCARGRLSLLGSAVASVLTIARSNGVGIEAAMRARMGSPKNVTAIVIITTDTRTTSTSVMMASKSASSWFEPLTTNDARVRSYNQFRM